MNFPVGMKLVLKTYPNNWISPYLQFLIISKGLVKDGLITTKKEGKWVYCGIKKEKFKNISNFLHKFINQQGVKNYEKKH